MENTANNHDDHKTDKHSVNLRELLERAELVEKFVSLMLAFAVYFAPGASCDKRPRASPRAFIFCLSIWSGSMCAANWGFKPAATRIVPLLLLHVDYAPLLVRPPS